MQPAKTRTQCISINLAPVINAGKVHFLCSTSVNNNCLTNTSECIVIRVDSEQATLLVSENNEEHTTPLQLKVDKVSDLTLNTAIKTNITETVETSSATLSQPEDVYLTGHIALHGNVQSAVGECLGNPQLQHYIEGFTVEWENRPDDVDIAYFCEIEYMGRTPTSLSGCFVGTRHRSLAIQSVSFSLIGSQAKNYQLSGQAFFNKQEPLNIITGIDSHGPTMKEALVALQIIVTLKV